ncbi:uncharacterized protein LOC110228621 isoform X2 [Arabidopsis lyrata subsp. lyrata]|uniref:uncharacterized protein LOC110228621 isoform X2 n=1 Tax=Arabidopsis lyrata subsp. lyrata TaxID=81972 RepID=UPI000A29C98E|nr:uncharacterized protein LOC110228621 isoform X2 [Arabidopsis lyrata subsp. lyrata]|eukprot:XP_020882075.1 uncharacterized protein LOC110228621 isoform X2 [Arabidopsis lyrata subsp. lyrata]
MRSWYLRFPIVQNGFFRLTQFSIMGHGRAIYWLLFRPYIPEIIIQEPGTVEMPDNIPDPRPSNQPSPDSPTDSQPSGLSEVGDCSASESPFPVAGISITFMLNQMLDLDAGIPRRIVLDNLLRLLSVEESASDIRHCTAFKLIDQQWLSMRASVAFNRKYFNLLYFAWNSKKSFHDLQWKQASDCSVSEYRSFVRFPSVNGSAFDLCNCIAFKLMGQQWLSRGASYMEFNKSFQDLQWKQAADCSASEYRNFVAGINITTVMLIERLELEAGIPRRIVLDNLLRLLSAVEESASDIRHCTACKLIDQQWLSMRASVAFNRMYINLLYFAWNSKKSFQDLQWKQAADCSASEYRNFVAGINITTVMLIERLELEAGIPRRTVLENLLRLLSVEESTSDFRHCTACKLIDQQWLSMRASVAFNRMYINLLYFAWNSKKSFQDLQWKQAGDCSLGVGIPQLHTWNLTCLILVWLANIRPLT